MSAIDSVIRSAGGNKQSLSGSKLLNKILRCTQQRTPRTAQKI
jgi:hypothetical protein